MNKVAPSPRRRIIVIDDNESIHADFRKILAPDEKPGQMAAAKAALFGSANAQSTTTHKCKFEVDCAAQGQQGVQMVESAGANGEPFLVAFVDMRMPGGWDGLTTIKNLWRVDPRIQVVICSAYSDHPLDQISDELGHSDNLLILKKPFDNSEIMQLAASLSEKWLAQRAAELKLDELEHIVKERTAEIEHAMLHDRLTSLPNRTLLLSRLEACIQRLRRQPADRFAVLFIDLDHFKVINDSLGHEIGDLLLIEIANRLKFVLRPGDAICRAGTPVRLGGDEFVVLLEDMHEERNAARVAQRLLDELSKPQVIANQTLYVSASIGIAVSDPCYEHAADMIRDADTAMYRAKAAGRCRYSMFDREMHEQITARFSLETALRQAIQNDELTLHYQPIIKLPDGRVTGFEALLRWNHPEQGPVSAMELIAIAEDTGLIHPLSMSVLSMACKQLREWQNIPTEGPPLMMSVNLSRKLLVDNEVVSKVERTIRESGIKPGTLILEITETAFLGDKRQATRILEQLRSIGVWLHLDDFGTGYSSLSCLFDLPLSGLKIDKDFIHRICDRAEYSVVLDAIVRIAQAFNLRVVAEGIETTEQYENVKHVGIDFAQGYLFGKPMTAQRAELSLKSGGVFAGVS